MSVINKNYFHFSISLNATHEGGKQAGKLSCDAADLLANETGLSKQKIKNAMQQGAVWLTRKKSQKKSSKRIRKGNTALEANDTLDIYYDENLLTAKPAIPVLIQDESAYTIWYKPRGLLSQGSLWGDAHAINRYAELQLKPQRPVFLIHRLDREACGFMLLVHNKKIAAQLSKLFQDRKVEKYYRALVAGDFNKENNKASVTLDKKLDGKAAISHVTPLYYDAENNCSLLSINIETGRKHQIRRHLADYGFPVLGDSLYGANPQKNSANLQLLSVHLAFVCPVKNKMQRFSLLETQQIKLPDNLDILLAKIPEI